MPNTLRIATFNIHKGFTHFNARFSLHLQRDMLRKLHADIIFLQEVQDMHTKHAERFATQPMNGQMAVSYTHLDVYKRQTLILVTNFIARQTNDTFNVIN